MSVPHYSTPAVITAGKQTAFALKDVGAIPMQITGSNLANLSDVIQDWTGCVPLVKQKVKMRVKFKNMLATLTTNTDWTLIGSFWMRIILFEHQDNLLYSGFRLSGYVGSSTPGTTPGTMPQDSQNRIVTAGWSNVTPYNTINPQFAWVPDWFEQFAVLDDSWLSAQLPNNTQISGTQVPLNQSAAV